MKRFIFLSIIFSLFFISKAYSWIIDDYDVEIKIEPDSSLKITERLVVDFENENKHGIYRDIPLELSLIHI